jgi:hypothetical protein
MMMYSNTTSFCYIAYLLLDLVAIISASPEAQGDEKPTQTSNPQPISQPTAGEILEAGTTYTIKWKPIAAIAKVSLEVHDDTAWGYSKGFGELCSGWLINPFCGEIASCVPNTGEYVWEIPRPYSYPRKDPYFWIELSSCGFYDPDVVSTNSYSENFGFAAEPWMSSSWASASSSSLAAEISKSLASQRTTTIKTTNTQGSSTETSDGFSGPMVTATVTVHDGSSQPPSPTTTSSIRNISVTSPSASASQTGSAFRINAGIYCVVVAFSVALLVSIW